MDAPVNPPVSRLAFSTLPGDCVTSAASMMLGGGALTVMRQWGYMGRRPAADCLTMGTWCAGETEAGVTSAAIAESCEAAGPTGCAHALHGGVVKMEVAGMMPTGGALTGGGQRWDIGAGGVTGGRLTIAIPCMRLTGGALGGGRRAIHGAGRSSQAILSQKAM